MGRIQLLLSVVGVTVLMGALVGSARARNLSTTSQTVTATFSRVEFIGGFNTVRCSFTMASSLHARTITKIPGALVGYVTAASVGGCDTGSATVLAGTLPWHMIYSGFTGALPNVTGFRVNVIGAGIRIREPTGFECLFFSTTATPLTRLERIVATVLNLVSLGGTGPCSGITGTISGTSNSLSPGEIRFTLI